MTLPLTYLPAAVQEIGRVTAPGGDLWLVLHSLDKTVRDLRASLRSGQWKRAVYRSYVLANGAAVPRHRPAGSVTAGRPLRVLPDQRRHQP